MDSQPPGAPPEKWVQRKDDNTRALFRKLDALTATLNERINATDRDVADLHKSSNRRLKQKVGYVALGAILTTYGGGVVSFAVNQTNQVRKEMAQARDQSANDIRQVREEQAGRTQNLEAKTNGIFNLLVEGRSKAAIREEVRRKVTQGTEE